MLSQPRECKAQAGHFLKSVFQHGAVNLPEDVLANVHNGVWSDAQNVRVVSRMMDLAEPDAIAHHWLALRMAIRKDMRGIEQYNVFEATDGALASIRCEYLTAKVSLVQTL